MRILRDLVDAKTLYRNTHCREKSGNRGFTSDSGQKLQNSTYSLDALGCSNRTLFFSSAGCVPVPFKKVRCEFCESINQVLVVKTFDFY